MTAPFYGTLLCTAPLQVVRVAVAQAGSALAHAAEALQADAALVRLASLAASALTMMCVASVRLCQHDRPPQVQRQLQLLSSGSTRLLDHRVGSRARVLGYL